MVEVERRGGSGASSSSATGDKCGELDPTSYFDGSTLRAEELGAPTSETTRVSDIVALAATGIRPIPTHQAQTAVTDLDWGLSRQALGAAHVIAGARHPKHFFGILEKAPQLWRGLTGSSEVCRPKIVMHDKGLNYGAIGAV